jgi:predicted nucleic acid-binding protein
MNAIADTGFLVAYLQRRDTHHAWAVAIAQRIITPLLTCEAVLAETAFHLQSTEAMLALVTSGMVRPALVVTDHLTRIAELAAIYADRNPDLADLCLVRLSELFPKHPVITTHTSDFRS